MWGLSSHYASRLSHALCLRSVAWHNFLVKKARTRVNGLHLLDSYHLYFLVSFVPVMLADFLIASCEQSIDMILNTLAVSETLGFS